MKKFIFKLDGLLKMRDFTEEQAKILLGETLKDIEECQDEIARLKDVISDSFDKMSRSVSSATDIKLATFYPLYIERLKADLERAENNLFALNAKAFERRKALAKAKADSDLIHKFKDKKVEKHKKYWDKKEANEIEDTLRLRRMYERGAE